MGLMLITISKELKAPLVAYMKILRCTNEDMAIDLGRFLENVKYKWISKIK